MKKSLIIVGIIIVLGLIGFQSYNGFVTTGTEVDRAWANVQTDYQRRFDLIPNLVSTVQGAAVQEQEVFSAVAEARGKVGSITLTADALNDPQALANFEAAQSGLSSALSRLLAVAENYPTLNSNENFLNLQSQLEGTENRIAVSRKDFNDSVLKYNLKVNTLPGKFFAKLFGFDARAFFEVENPTVEQAPAVDFSGLSN